MSSITGIDGLAEASRTIRASRQLVLGPYSCPDGCGHAGTHRHMLRLMPTVGADRCFEEVVQ